MAKKRTTRQRVKDKSTKQNREEDLTTDSVSEAQVVNEDDEGSMRQTGARVQRKVVKQMRFLERLQKTQQVLATTKTLGKKKRRKSSQNVGLALGTLPELADLLPSLEELGKNKTKSPRPLAKVLHNKGRQKITSEETKQLAAVISHPAYKTNPLAAIRQHLLNTMPPPPPQTLTGHRNTKDKNKKKKQKYTGEEPIVTSEMDVC